MRRLLLPFALLSAFTAAQRPRPPWPRRRRRPSPPPPPSSPAASTSPTRPSPSTTACAWSCTRTARRRSSRCHLVQCRLQGRAGRQDRLRPPVRASAVQRLRERARRLFRAAARDRRHRLERHHLVRPHQLLPDRADAGARPGAVHGERPHGPSARRAQPGAARQPARRRAERKAPGRQPALRPGRIRAARGAVPRRPSLPPLDHRLDGRPRRRQPRGRRSGSATTTARTTRCWCSPATSTPPTRGRWSRSISATSRAAR